MAFTGADACTIFLQDRQLYLGRMVRTTRHCTSTASSIPSLSCPNGRRAPPQSGQVQLPRSAEHTSELQYLMRISHADFCSQTQQIMKFTYHNYHHTTQDHNSV